MGAIAILSSLFAAIVQWGLEDLYHNTCLTSAGGAAAYFSAAARDACISAQTAVQHRSANLASIAALFLIGIGLTAFALRTAKRSRGSAARQGSNAER